MTLLLMLLLPVMFIAVYAALYYTRPQFRAGVESPKYEMLAQEERF